MSKNSSSSKFSLWQILLSVLAALFGVQSTRVRERDFSGERPWWAYVLVGIGVVIVLVILLLALTKFIVLMAH